MTEDRRLCGWRLHSDIALPDLPAWTGDDRPPDLIVRLGAVPPWPEIPLLERTKVQLADGGACRFAVEGVAVYLVDAQGHTVVVDPAPGCDATAPAIRDFLLGTVLTILCQRRRLWPLHACCVRLGHKAVAFAGHSGAGKSTLAAAFLAHGCEILSDDITVIDVAAAQGAMALPSVPRLKLWRDTATQIGLLTDPTADPAPSHKDRLPLNRHVFALDPLPLAAVYHLVRAEDDAPLRIQPLRGMEAVSAASRAFHRRRLLIGLGGGRETLLTAAMSVAATVPAHWRLERPFGFAALHDLVAAIAEREGAPR